MKTFAIMSEQEFRERFPNASKSTIEANLRRDVGSETPLAASEKPATRQAKRKKEERKVCYDPLCLIHDTPSSNGRLNENHPHPQLQDPEQPEQTPALGGESEGKAQGSKRPRVGFSLFRVKLLDWDAKYASIKDLLDGLTTAGLIHGDREDQIDPQSYVRQVKVAHKREERTQIDIEWPDA